MCLFDALPHLFQQSRALHGDFSLFLALENIQKECFEQDNINGKSFIRSSLENDTFFAVPLCIDYWETTPLLEKFDENPIKLPKGLIYKVTKILEISEQNVSAIQAEDKTVFSFTVPEHQLTSTEQLCSLFKELLQFVDPRPPQEISIALFPMGSAESFTVIMTNNGDTVDLKLYNIFGGECGRLEGISFIKRQQMALHSQNEAAKFCFISEDCSSSIASSTLSDEVFLSKNTTPPDPFAISLITTCLNEMNFNTATLSPNESFISFGLDSLELVELEQRLSEKLGVTLPIAAVERNTSLETLAHFIRCFIPRLGKKDSFDIPVETVPIARPNKWQRKIISADMLESSFRAQFNETVRFHVDPSRIMRDTLTNAMLSLVMVNPNLRALYTYHEKHFLSGTESYILPNRSAFTQFIEFGLDVSKSPPINWSIQEEEITIIFHHIAVDGRSLQIVIEQFKRILDGEEIFVNKDVFKEIFDVGDEDNVSGLVIDRFPSDFPISQNIKRIARIFKKDVPFSFVNFLNQLRLTYRVTDFEAFFAAFSLLVRQRTGMEEVSLGTAVSVREEFGFDTVDCLVNVVSVQIKVEKMNSLSQYVQSIAEKLKNVKRNIHSMGSGPIQILLVMDKVEQVNIRGLEPLESVPAVCKYEQTWYFRKIGRNYEIVVEYCSELYLEETIKVMVEDLLLTVKRMAQSSNNTSESLNLSRMRKQCCSTIDYPRVLIDAMITKKKYNSFSWVYEENHLSQDELLASSFGTSWNWEQTYIQHFGEAPMADRQVVIFLSRGLHLGSYTLAAWNLGMSIVPISRDWPHQRIKEMVRRLHNPLVVTNDVELAKILQQNEFCMYWNRMSNVSMGYITCTSGSTGVPKAVCSSIRGLSNLAMNYARKFLINQRSNIYQVVNYAFDIFFADLCKTLSTGASLIFAEKSIPDWSELKKCTNAYIMPAVLSSLPTNTLNQLSTLETLQFGGERIHSVALSRLLNTGINLYQEFGLTEQCVYSSVVRLKKNVDPSSLGIPYNNLLLFVKDSSGNVLNSNGCRGELFVKGFTARGYHGLEKQNRKRFTEEGFATRDQVIFCEQAFKLIGRMDLQVKISGRRIELSEIEVVLCQHPAVEGAVVTVVNEKIYAHIRTQVNPITLRKFAADYLPDYMVPEKFIIVEEFPLNANGKIDKKKLVISEDEEIYEMDTLDQPITETEKIICEAMSQILGNSIEVNECFFKKAGNSVKAMLVIQLLKEKGLDVTIKDFFETKTARKLGARLLLRESNHSLENNIFFTKESKEIKEKIIPLSHVQRRVWFLQKFRPSNDSYIFRLKIMLEQRIDNRQLLSALCKVINHNPYLRAEIIEQDGVPYWKIREPIENIEAVNCQLLKIMLNGGEVTLEINHLLFDGRSIALLAEQLEKALMGENLPVQHEISTKEEETDLRFWREYLEEVDIHRFPSRHQPSADFENEVGRSIVSIPKIIINKLRSYFDRYGVFPVLLFAVVKTMKKVFDNEDIILGTTVANRTVENYNTVGMFSNTLPMRFIEKTTLLSVTEQIHTILERQNSSLEKIQQIVRGELISCLVNYLNTSLHSSDFSFGKVYLEEPKHSQFLLSWIFYDQEDGVGLTLEYDRSHLADIDIENFKKWFLKELLKLTGVRTTMEQKKEFRRDFPRKTVTSGLQCQRKLSESELALDSATVRLNYTEFVIKSLRMSEKIQQRILQISGNSPRSDDVIVLHLDEGPILHLVINMVLWLGCAYTVIPKNIPEERKQKIVTSVRPILVVDDAEQWDWNVSLNSRNSLRKYYEKTIPENLMYVMFTSGSTGQPKGVPIAHLGVSNMLLHATRLYCFCSKGRILQFTKSHFDASISNTFGALINGCTLCLIEQEKEAGMAVSSLLPLSVLHMTPTILDYLSDNVEILEEVETWSIGGESPSESTISRLISEGTKIIQLYGPTEATCYQTAASLKRKDSVNYVGYAVPNLPHGVCSWSSYPVQSIDVGQFFCGGIQLSRGYLDNSLKTQKSFVSNPFQSVEDRIMGRNQKIYLSGDRVRVSNKGQVSFIGRRDQQVKISGHRIEIGEVEAAINRLDGIDLAVVVLQKDPIGKSHLIAFYKGEKADYQNKLTRSLPSHMIPIKMIYLEQFPLSINGKVDRNALSFRTNLEIGTTAEITSNMEEEVLKIYKSVLNMETLSIEDNFFHVGGHSLLAVRLAHRLEKHFQATVPLPTVFIEDTPRKMSKFIEKTGISEQSVIEEMSKQKPSQLQLPLIRLFTSNSFQEMYTNQVRIRLLKKISIEKQKKLFHSLLIIHPALRIQFQKTGKEISQKLNPHISFEDIHATKEQFLDVLKKPPIMVQLGENELLLKTSHAVVDGYSMKVLVKNIEMILSGQEVSNNDRYFEFNQYIDNFFARQKQKSMSYWKRKLENFAQNSLKTDYPKKFPQKFESSSLKIKILSLKESLHWIAKSSRITPFCALLSIVSTAMREHVLNPTGQISLAFPINMRTPEFDDTVTMGVNTTVILLPYVEEPKKYLKQVSSAVTESLTHPIPIGELTKLLEQRQKLYELMVTYDDYSIAKNEFFEVVTQPEKYSKCEITIFANPNSDEVVIDYVKELFEQRTIQKLARRMEQLVQTFFKPPSEERLPDSFSLTLQQNQIFISSFSTHSRVLPFIVKKPPGLDIHRLNHILQLLVQKYEALRTVFYVDGNGNPRQRILSITEAFRFIKVEKYDKEKAADSVKMDKNVLEVILDENFVTLYLHHIVTDAWSTRILERELEELIHTDVQEVKPLKQSIRYLIEKGIEKEIPSIYIDLIQSAIEPFLKKFDTNIVFKRTFNMSKNNENTFTRLILALSTMFRQSINVGFPFANRNTKNSKLLGYFLNNIVINISESDTAETITTKKKEAISLNMPYLDLVSLVRQLTQNNESLFQIYLNCRYDLETTKPDDEEILSMLPLTAEFPLEIDVDSYHNVEKVTMRGLSTYFIEKEFDEIVNKLKTILSSDSRTSNTILDIIKKLLKKEVTVEDNFFNVGGNSLQAIELAEELEDALGIEIDVEVIYSAKTINEISNHFDSFYKTAKNSAKVEELKVGKSCSTEENNLTTPITSYQVLNGTKCDLPRGTFYALFENLYDSNKPMFILPDHSAVSYSEVINNASRKAYSLSQKFLQNMGRSIRSDDTIPVIGKKSIDVWINCFAVQFSGAAYLPITSASPISKIQGILEQAHTNFYIGEEIKLSVTRLNVDPICERKLFTRNLACDLAYVISTSGTTGAPKAACIQHKGVINMTMASIQDLFLAPRDMIYQFTNFCYDNSVLELFSAVASSSQLFLDISSFTPRRFAKQIPRHKISHCLLFPGLVSKFKEDTFTALKDLRYWVTGAEKLSDILLQQAMKHQIHVIQNYGPTETTCYCLTRHMKKGDLAANLGKPIQNVTVTVSEDELFVAGQGLMRGYLNRSLSFVPINGSLWYATGDNVRMTKDKYIMFQGRKDNQVKIRGHRVELGEVEEKILSLEKVDQCKVKWEDPFLIAYCVTTNTEEQIKKHCEKVLLPHMRPNEIKIMMEFPLTENFKIDFKQLKNSAFGEEDSVIIMTAKNFCGRNLDINKTLLEQGWTSCDALKIVQELEHKTGSTLSLEDLLTKPFQEITLTQKTHSKVAQAWKQVLGHSNFSKKSHFLLSGGTSLHVLRLKIELQKLGIEVSVPQLISNLILEDMEKLDCPRVVIQFSSAKTPLRTVVFVHALYGGAAAYIHLIPLMEDNNTRILAIEHPNTFTFTTQNKLFFDSIESLVDIYSKQLEEYLVGDIILCGVSIGGTLAVEIGKKLAIKPKAVVVVDTLAMPDLESYSYWDHKEQVLKECPFATNAVLANSWDLLQMLRKHTWNEVDFPISLLSVDGTDLGWNSICRGVTITSIEKSHSALLSSLAVSDIANILKTLY